MFVKFRAVFFADAQQTQETDTHVTSTKGSNLMMMIKRY